jgi:hypothetical protein
MTTVKLKVEVDLADVDTSDILDELDGRGEWDDVCGRAPTVSLEGALNERDDTDLCDYREGLESIYELLHQGKEAAALDRVRELACAATGRVL